MKEQALLYLFVFSDFTVSLTFSCFTDFTVRQIGHLYKSTFISPQSFFLLQVQRKHQQSGNQSRRRVYTQYDSTTERLYILLAFRLARANTGASGWHCCSWITIKSYHSHFVCFEFTCLQLRNHFYIWLVMH